MAYEIVSSVLQQLDADVGASEAHGIAVGMLCIDIRSTSTDWIASLFSGDTVVSGESEHILQTLFEQTRNLLDDENEQFEFDLLLPDENEELSLRAEAISCWCQGFLFGIGHTKSTAEWTGESGEILRDIVEITKLETDTAEEDDENALVEIHEYLRSAILLIRDELLEDSDTPTLH
jgi:uncharacterized protein